MKSKFYIKLWYPVLTSYFYVYFHQFYSVQESVLPNVTVCILQNNCVSHSSAANCVSYDLYSKRKNAFTCLKWKCFYIFLYSVAERHLFLSGTIFTTAQWKQASWRQVGECCCERTHTPIFYLWNLVCLIFLSSLLFSFYTHTHTNVLTHIQHINYHT